jgi:ubiquinone/menaquinone biosynthesis C-methylase UbiE
VAKEKSKELGIALADYIKGDALNLGAFPEEKYDVVLLMGPLYHLMTEEDRQKSVKEALRLLKKGGIILASFISKYAPLNEALIYLNINAEEDNSALLLHYLEDGENKEENGFTTAYFTGMEEARQLMADYGLKQLAFAGVENVLGYKETEINQLEKKLFDKYIDIGYTLSQDMNLIGAGMHFLYVGQK